MIKQFSVGFSRTVNLGNFESARVEANVVTEISEHDDRGIMTIMEEAQLQLRRLLEETWKAQFKPKEQETVMTRYGR